MRRVPWVKCQQHKKLLVIVHLQPASEKGATVENSSSISFLIVLHRSVPKSPAFSLHLIIIQQQNHLTISSLDLLVLVLYAEPECA
jgi:hypothetical protein